MATNNNKPVTEAKPQNKPAKPKESVYTARELAQAYKIFNTSYAIVATALKLAGKEKATLAEAKEIIKKFKNKEVK